MASRARSAAEPAATCRGVAIGAATRAAPAPGRAAVAGGVGWAQAVRLMAARNRASVRVRRRGFLFAGAWVRPGDVPNVPDCRTRPRGGRPQARQDWAGRQVLTTAAVGDGGLGRPTGRG